MIRLCTAEDLIVYKLASDRRQDEIDVEGVILKQSRRLDRGYLAPRVRELAMALERPAILARFEAMLRKGRTISRPEKLLVER